MKSLVITCSITLLLYLILCIIMYMTQRRQIYFPTPETVDNRFVSFHLPVTGATIKIWQLHHNCEPAIIYFGGNAEDTAGNLAPFDKIFPDYTIYMVNYRGYGGSSGKPSETALNSDAITLFDSIKDKHSNISVIGRSLGSAIAVYLASLRPVERLALITPFASLADVAQAHLFYLPVRLLLQDRYEVTELLPAIKARTLVIVAEEDEIIPRKQSNALIKALSGKPCEVVTIPGTGHNSLDQHDQYHKTLEDFFALLPSPQALSKP